MEVIERLLFGILGAIVALMVKEIWTRINLPVFRLWGPMLRWTPGGRLRARLLKECDSGIWIRAETETENRLIAAERLNFSSPTYREYLDRKGDAGLFKNYSDVKRILNEWVDAGIMRRHEMENKATVHTKFLFIESFIFTEKAEDHIRRARGGEWNRVKHVRMIAESEEWSKRQLQEINALMRRLEMSDGMSALSIE